ncbi:MAG: lipopolysaccharide heptosyltransferase I [Methylococcaceae bacterium]|nr:lipopolysaccharide heptosyltransferase I [Methylococcaceae bacterium]
MKIGIVKLSALGDIVHAMVALQFIKQAFPQIVIDWIVEERFAGVLHENPDINQIYTVNIKSLKKNKSNFFKELRHIKSLSKNNYDLVIDAQGLLKSSILARVISSKTVGFDKHSAREKVAALFYEKKISCPYDKNTIDRNVTVITQPLDLEISREQILDKVSFLFYKDWDSTLGNYYSRDKANIIFVIGSTWPSRNYPKEKYLKVIKKINAQSLIVWGNDQEKKDADWIAERTEKVRVLPKLDFNNLKAVLAHSDLVIGNDTGPTHMAWGLNKPSITLFGPTPVSRVYQTTINKVLKSSSIVNPSKLNKNDFSIQEITENQVVELADLLLRNE